MVMIRKLHNMKIHIAALLLTGFVSVFACDALCNLGLISWGNYTAVVEKADPHHMSGHDHDHHVADSDHQHDQDHHNKSDQEECCDEIVNNLYSSLIKYELKQNTVEVPTLHLLYEVHVIDFEAKNFLQKSLSFFYANLPPPISGFHIRIFIQSFLN